MAKIVKGVSGYKVDALFHKIKRNIIHNIANIVNDTVGTLYNDRRLLTAW